MSNTENIAEEKDITKVLTEKTPIKRDGNKSLSFNDINEVISKKILINKVYAEYARLHAVYCNASISLEKHIIEMSEERRKLLDKLNSVYELQLTNFTEERQEECKLIMDSIDILALPTADYVESQKKCEQCSSQMKDLMIKISYLESTLPTEALVTNYKVKLQDGTNTSCSAELLDEYPE